MLLIEIENKKILTKLVSYLDMLEIPYTTDRNMFYDKIVFAQFNQKTIDILKHLKPDQSSIFLTDLEDEKILKYQNEKSKIARNYFLKWKQILNQNSRVITHMSGIAKILESKLKCEIVVVPLELPIINISRTHNDIYEKYRIPRRKKKILILDFEYKHASQICDLVNQYVKYHYIYIGYESDNLLNEKNKEAIHKMPKNVTKMKYIDFNQYSDLCKICNMVILYDDTIIEEAYLDITLLFKKQLLVKENRYYDGFLENKKNCYFFHHKEELLKLFPKLIEEKLPNLTDQGYALISKNTKKEVLRKYNLYLR